MNFSHQNARINAAAAKARKLKSLDPLVEAMAPLIRTVTKGWFIAGHDMADLEQEAWTIMPRILESWSGQGHFGGWFRVNMRSHYHDMQKGARVRSAVKVDKMLKYVRYGECAHYEDPFNSALGMDEAKTLADTLSPMELTILEGRLMGLGLKDIEMDGHSSTTCRIQAAVRIKMKYRRMVNKRIKSA